MSRRVTLIFIAAALLAAVCGACGLTEHSGNGADNYFSDFASMPRAEWLYDEPQTFRVDTLRDSVARGGDLVVAVRHTHGYPYANLWLEVSYPVNDSVTHADTVNIVLADAFGRWHGRGSGPSLQIADTVARNFTIARGMPLTVRHIMRVDTLHGIEQIGIVYFP